MDPKDVARYSFLPWVRQGLGNRITAPPVAGSHRSSIVLELGLRTDNEALSVAPINRELQLVGPGDVIGISKEAVVRTEPRDWTTEFEPNLLAFVEFRDEDFPWRHTPNPPDRARHRLTPWLTLVVLEESEFESLAATGTPLASIRLRMDASLVFPPSDQLWAWAHVHVNEDLMRDESGAPRSLARGLSHLGSELEARADVALSRLLCPRRLRPNTGYHAFLLPTFESGRRAGLSEPAGGEVAALDLAWGAGQDRFPYYLRWYFRTCEDGDFEYLVRRLQARAAERDLGIRDMDVSAPAPGIPAIDRGPNEAPVVGMEGALRAPATRSTAWPHDYPDPFQRALAARINMQADYREASPDEDPIVTPPLYGGRHLLRDRLSLARDSGPNPYDPQAKWLTELNLDPRWRAAAGLGTRVVQKHQEALMQQAWEQVGAVLEANRRLRTAQLAEAAGLSIHRRRLLPLPDLVKLLVTNPVHKRLTASPVTLHKVVRESRVPTSLFSPELRRALRPRGRLTSRFSASERGGLLPALLTGVNAGRLHVAPAKHAPEGANTFADVRAALPTLPHWLAWLRGLGMPWWLPLLLGLVLLLLLAAAGALWLGLAGVAISGALALQLRRAERNEAARAQLSEEGLTPEAVDRLPSSPDFRVTAPGEPRQFATGGRDSVEAVRFKQAARDLHEVFVLRASDPAPRPALDVRHLAERAMAGLDPRVTVRRRVLNTLILPERIRLRLPDRIVPVMAYPEFPQPMYELLTGLSSDFLVPNLNRIPPNTVCLLETNQRFIEAFMVGVNHELAREWQWRGGPGDLRSSGARQFWDPSDDASVEAASEEERAEARKDIPEIHRWPSTSALGMHNLRVASAGTAQLVLLVRGDLLKRYPNAVVYAHRARWPTDIAGRPRRDEPRVLAPSDDVEDEQAHVRLPLFSAKVEPDIFLLGFNLTAEQARGTDEDPGWFFGFKQRVGMPCFGADIEDGTVTTELNEFDDVSWADLEPDLNEHGILRLPADPTQLAPARNPDGVGWHADASAADVAYVLLQDPVLVAIHAQELLSSRGSAS